jgi:hypothetical protein
MAKKVKKTEEAPVVLKQVVVAEAPKSWYEKMQEKLADKNNSNK